MRKWLFDLRKNRDLTQQELSKKLNVSQSYYAQIESGDRQPVLSLSLAAKLADIFNVSLSAIRNHEELLAKENKN